jgi:UDP-N-acetylglucosamine transferase subunit ALG13
MSYEFSNSSDLPRIGVIFVAVGTTDFDALVQAMDHLCPTLAEDVVMQIGHGHYEPQHAQFFRFAPSLKSYYESSSLIVAHGGLGITMEVLEQNKPLVSVSNPDRYDRHQDDLLEILEAGGYLRWCRELSQLTETLEQARKTAFNRYVKPECRIAEVIRDFLTGNQIT